MHRIYIALFLVLVLAGCSSGPTASSMVASYRGQSNITEESILAIDEVTGGKETNPMFGSSIDNESFREALHMSLKNSNLYRHVIDKGPGDYKLGAQILSQEVKYGINTTATLMVRYELYSEKEKKVIWTENIFSQHEALFEETFSGGKRAQLANEGVVKKNLTELLKQLSRLQK